MDGKQPNGMDEATLWPTGKPSHNQSGASPSVILCKNVKESTIYLSTKQASDRLVKVDGLAASLDCSCQRHSACVGGAGRVACVILGHHVSDLFNPPTWTLTDLDPWALSLVSFVSTAPLDCLGTLEALAFESGIRYLACPRDLETLIPKHLDIQRRFNPAPQQ
jgi:hypothetical protein